MAKEKEIRPEQMSQQEKNNKIVRWLVIALIILVIIIILLLLRSCGKEKGPATVLDPDYAHMGEDSGAEPIEDDETSKAEVTGGGGSVTISFTDDVRYSLSTGQLSLYYQNPNASTHNVVVQVILVSGEDEYLLAQSGILKPGYQVTSLTAEKNAPKLSVGGYKGRLTLLFYDPETGERAIVDTDIPCTVTVTE